jgi:hypothetical protein
VPAHASSGARDGREARRRAAGYVAARWAEPEEADVRWLAQTATNGDSDHARWELRYARRAVGLLAAERDALDDRTPSLVARAMDEAMATDPAVAVDAQALAARQFNDRLAAYRDALAARSAEAPGTRLGRVLLVFAGSVRAARGAGLVQAGEILTRELDEANAALRTAFGTAELPEDEPPSAVAARPRG